MTRYRQQCLVAWQAVESNPETFNELCSALGVPREWAWGDVYGLEPDLLALVPQPVAAVMLLWPSGSETILALKAAQRDVRSKLSAEGGRDPNENVFYMRQRVRNACVTVAAAHAVANCGSSFQLLSGSVKHSFLDQCNSAVTTPSKRGRIFAESDALKALHDACVASEHNQTSSPEAGSNITEHFCAFVRVADSLVKLDGSLEAAPIWHGPTSEESFLGDVAAVVRTNYMDNAPGSNSWSIMALAKGTMNNEKKAFVECI